jgi:YHS domain-containing protein
MSRSIRIGGTVAVLLGLALLALGCSGGKKDADVTAPTGEGSPKASLANAAKPQTTCPVMGNKINKAIYADHEGKRVYFCCAGCVDTFKGDPGKYLKKLEDEGVTIAKAPGAEGEDKDAHKGHEHD